MEMASDSRREPSAGRVSPFRIQSRYAEPRKLTNAKVDIDKVDVGSKDTETNDLTCQIFLPRRNGGVQTINSEETREDAKHGTAYRSGFSGSAESNAGQRSDSCTILALKLLICFMCSCILISLLFHNH
jgi:katanin p80 WD40 repeat-containing subunit B1